MNSKEAIQIIERLKDAYSKQKHSDDIVTALAFAIDSIVIVGDIIEGDWEDDIYDKNFS